ncbi:MAG: isocitrate/isopropylmalate family dehydrogenase, partial [Albidovulum sp.]
GSAPDLAGRDLANPASLIGSAGMLLEWLGERRGQPALSAAGGEIMTALDRVVADPKTRTRDLGGQLGTRAFAERVAAAVRDT